MCEILVITAENKNIILDIPIKIYGTIGFKTSPYLSIQRHFTFPPIAP